MVKPPPLWYFIGKGDSLKAIPQNNINACSTMTQNSTFTIFDHMLKGNLLKGTTTQHRSLIGLPIVDLVNDHHSKLPKTVVTIYNPKQQCQTVPSSSSVFNVISNSSAHSSSSHNHQHAGWQKVRIIQSSLNVEPNFCPNNQPVTIFVPLYVVFNVQGTATIINAFCRSAMMFNTSECDAGHTTFKDLSQRAPYVKNHPLRKRINVHHQPCTSWLSTGDTDGTLRLSQPMSVPPPPLIDTNNLIINVYTTTTTTRVGHVTETSFINAYAWAVTTLHYLYESNLCHVLTLADLTLMTDLFFHIQATSKYATHKTHLYAMVVALHKTLKYTHNVNNNHEYSRELLLQCNVNMTNEWIERQSQLSCSFYMSDFDICAVRWLTYTSKL